MQNPALPTPAPTKAGLNPVTLPHLVAGDPELDDKLGHDLQP